MAKDKKIRGTGRIGGRTGWIIPVLNKMVNKSVVTLPTQVGQTQIAPTSGPLTLNHSTLQEAIEACAIAVQGHSTKQSIAKQTPATGNLVLEITEKAFGYVVRYSAPATEFPGGMIPFTALFDEGLATERTFAFTIKGSRHIYEAIILSYSDNAGKGQIVPATTLKVTVDVTKAAIVASSTWVSLESLNSRDLGVSK